MANTTKEQNVVDIVGVSLKAREAGLPYVPQNDPAYAFGEHTYDVASDLLENKAVILTGHAGVGKSSLFLQIAAQIGQPVVRANLNGQMSVSDFVGGWKIKGGETIWVDGVLTQAMRLGYWLVLDEIDCAEPNILAALNTVTEPLSTGTPHRILTLKEKDHEIVQAHEHFRIMGTANTVGAMGSFRHIYQGTNVMNEAFLDRFRVYLVKYLAPEKEVEVLMGRYNSRGLSKPLAEKMVEIANLIRSAFTREEIRSSFSMRRLFDWIEQTIRHAKNPKYPIALDRVLYAAEAVIFSKIPVTEDVEVIKNLITKVLGAKFKAPIE